MPAAFDEKELLDRVDNDWEFLGETVQMLSSDGPALIVQVTSNHAAARGIDGPKGCASISHWPGLSATKAMRSVCRASIAKLSSQNGFQPSSSRSRRRA